MEIEKAFSTIEEIKAEIEKEGFTFRFSFDEEEDETEKNPTVNEKYEILQANSMIFATESDPEEIEKWEAALQDIDDEEEEEAENAYQPNPGNESEKKPINESEKKPKNENETKPENATVLYFDLFKKRTYVKTLIFQKEEAETGETIYLLVGFCEAPMAG